jgi:hypothetical protein
LAEAPRLPELKETAAALAAMVEAARAAMDRSEVRFMENSGGMK